MSGRRARDGHHCGGGRAAGPARDGVLVWEPDSERASAPSWFLEVEAARTRTHALAHPIALDSSRRQSQDLCLRANTRCCPTTSSMPVRRCRGLRTGELDTVCGFP